MEVECKKAGRSRFLGSGLGLALWCAGLVGVAGAATITEFPIPTLDSRPSGIAAGPDGALWFTELFGNKVGRITTAGTITEFSPPTPGFFPGAITVGPDGALWFTLRSPNKIGRITTAGAITEFPLPTADYFPIDITAGPDGALWFTENLVNDNRYIAKKIGRITTAGTITEFSLPADYDVPSDITAGPDGALWFTLPGANKIGRITPAGTITEFTIPTPDSSPSDITAGPDGALWFTEYVGNKIGRITPAGTMTEFTIPTPGSQPMGITAGPDGALWFTEYIGNKIGRITTAGTITEFAIPTPDSFPSDITAGPDGALWFTEWAADKIGQIALDLAGSVAVSLSGSDFHTDQTITYEGTLTPGSNPVQVDIYLGFLLPDGVTFISLVEAPSGGISIVGGPSPIPIQANATISQAVVPFSYTFAGYEPVGKYVAYAALAIAGSNPLLPENQLSVAVQSFEFSSDVCLSVSVDAGGSVTISPPGSPGGPNCFRAFAPGTTVNLTAQGQSSTFDGWSGDCASAGTHATCMLVMTTNKHVGASFSTAGPGGPGGYGCVFFLCGPLVPGFTPPRLF